MQKKTVLTGTFETLIHIRVRELHGNGDSGNTAVTREYRGNGNESGGNTAGMGLIDVRIPRGWSHLTAATLQ